MLKDKSSSAIVAVSDLDRARLFYERSLGLTAEGESGEDVVSYRTGDTSLIVYRSDDARPGTGNAVVWGAGHDFASIVDDLRSRGVTFEDYPELGMAIENGVHTADGFSAAWFKDPDGNILHVNSM